MNSSSAPTFLSRFREKAKKDPLVPVGKRLFFWLKIQGVLLFPGMAKGMSFLLLLGK